MKRATAAVALCIVGVIALAGCSAPEPAPDAKLDSARVNCLDMAHKAIPNGIADPDDTTQTLTGAEFCKRLEAGMKPEAFKEAYNDPAFLQQEIESWSKHNLQP